MYLPLALFLSPGTLTASHFFLPFLSPRQIYAEGNCQASVWLCKRANIPQWSFSIFLRLFCFVFFCFCFLAFHLASMIRIEMFSQVSFFGTSWYFMFIDLQWYHGLIHVVQNINIAVYCSHFVVATWGNDSLLDNDSVQLILENRRNDFLCLSSGLQEDYKLLQGRGHNPSISSLHCTGYLHAGISAYTLSPSC